MTVIAQHTIPGTTSVITIQPAPQGFEVHRSLDAYHGIKPFSAYFTTEEDARRSANGLWLGAVEARGPLPADWPIDGPGPLPTMLEMAAQTARAGRVEVTEGLWMSQTDGEVWKVQIAHHGSGHLYAKRLAKDVGRFEYVAGGLNMLRNRAPRKLTLDEAKEWGKLYGTCISCGATLTDEDSIAAGIGPICATKF